jgi:hypothetical protein
MHFLEYSCDKHTFRIIECRVGYKQRSTFYFNNFLTRKV